MTAPLFPANLVCGGGMSLPRTHRLAMIETFATARKTGLGKRCFRPCFPRVLRSVSPESRGKSGTCPTPKTIKRPYGKLSLCARARERVRLFYRFTVLDIYQSIDIVCLFQKLPKTRGKTVPEIGLKGAFDRFTRRAFSRNPLKSHKKGGF